MSSAYKDLGALLKHLRKKQNITQRKFVEYLNENASDKEEHISFSLYSKLESGNITSISQKRLLYIGHHLRAEIKTLLRFHEEVKDKPPNKIDKYSGIYLSLSSNYRKEELVWTDFYRLYPQLGLPKDQLKAVRLHEEDKTSRYFYSGTATASNISLYIDLLERGGEERLHFCFNNELGTVVSAVYGFHTALTTKGHPVVLKTVLIKLHDDIDLSTISTEYAIKKETIPKLLLAAMINQKVQKDILINDVMSFFKPSKKEISGVLFAGV